MKHTFNVALVAVLALSACNSKSAKTAQSPQPSDAVQQKLVELAGSGATNCGAPKSQQPADVQPATDCALKAAQTKQAFYVRYDLPGMTTAMAGNAQGQLFAIQSEAGKVDSTPCPAEIRVAGSGRVTCYSAGSMGGMGTMGGDNPHGGMGTTGGTNPHGGMEMPPATGPNPHQGSMAPSHGNPPAKQPKP
ncbi:MAG: hypothetical protein ROO76_21705 [Terriglobia bacterium]|jgi:hypothetical protein|nr:hypothetical protein [Terriglobia bacterium]